MPIKKLYKFFENLPVPLRFIDEENHFTYYNESFKTLVSDVNSKEIYDLWYMKIHSDDIDNYLDKLDKSLSLQKPFQFTYRFLGSGNIYKTFVDNGTPYFTDEKKFKGLIVSTLTSNKQEMFGQTDISMIYFYNAINMIIVEAEDKTTLFIEICKSAVQKGQFEMARIAVPNPGTKTFHNIAYYAKTEKGYEYISQHEAFINKNDPKGSGKFYCSVAPSSAFR